MPSLEVRSFKSEDYESLAGYPTEHSLPAFTALVDGERAACAGVALFPRARVGHAWAYVGPLGRKHGFFISRAVVRGLRAIITDYGLVRVEADTLLSWEVARGWLRWMGFVEEGAMLLRGPNGETMVRYALFPRPGR